MRIAIQMDPINTINVQGDSSWMMILEALRRGYCVFHYHPNDLSWDNQGEVSANISGNILARMQKIMIAKSALKGTPTLADIELSAAESQDLALFDVVLMRQDPPFDMHYLSATYLLERLPPHVVLVNNPAEVRNNPEKIFVMDFAQFMPETIISTDKVALYEFWQHHGHVIAKPLYGNGGAGIIHLRPDDDNFDSLWEMHLAHYRTPMQLQRFIPEVSLGDKRILLIDGKPGGAIDRVPQKGQARANMHVGGTAIQASLTDREREICAAIGPKLNELGMIFVGIDVIAGFMTEINVTSPTGIQEVNRFDGVHIERLLWDSIEAHRLSKSAI